MQITPTQSWQEEFGIQPIRYSRGGFEHVVSLLKSAWPPAVELRESHVADATEIVISFPGTSQKLPNLFREVYFGYGMTLDKAFQEVLRTRLQQKMLRSELAGLGYNAYREAWLHLIRLLYKDNSHDKANKVLSAEIRSLERSTRRGRRGKESEVDRNNLLKRYAELLLVAQRVHGAAIRVTAQFSVRARRIPANERVTRIRAGIWDDVKDLYGKRVAHLIFSGEAFQRISEAEKGYTIGDHFFLVRLESPSDWSPEDLATSVLSLEEDKSYNAIRGKIKTLRKQAHGHSATKRR
jgi:hypothetical protein